MRIEGGALLNLHRGPALGGTGITGAGVCADPAVGRLGLGAHDEGGAGNEDGGELHFGTGWLLLLSRVCELK